jgi:hypothetical protein
MKSIGLDKGESLPFVNKKKQKNFIDWQFGGAGQWSVRSDRLG